MQSIQFQTPLGLMAVDSCDRMIRRLRWGTKVRVGQKNQDVESAPELVEARAQILAYFDGELTDFDLPVFVDGSGFQRAVCDAMSSIPLGDTLTYGEIAALTGASAQAVGNACGANPIPVIIPCHRVLGAHSLGGFSGAGGVESKVWLLRHEGAAGLLI